jgi:hypothetical protein
MPETVKQKLVADPAMVSSYVLLWVDSLDYGYGFDDLTKIGVCSGFASKLVLSADRNLRAAVELLTLGNRPNCAAMDAARMSTEMFMKAYLACHGNLDAKGAEGISHNLVRAAEACLATADIPEFRLLLQHVGVYPSVGARYEGRNYSYDDLSLAYSLAQIAGVTLTRTLTNRDSRPQLHWQG